MNTDKRILRLREEIKAKLEKISKMPEAELVIDGSLRMGNGDWLNLSTTTKEIATSMLIDLNSRRLSAANLGISYLINGHPVEDWIADLQVRLVQLEVEEERARLGALERQLAELLSEEKKREIAVKAIAEKLDK